VADGGASADSLPSFSGSVWMVDGFNTPCWAHMPYWFCLRDQKRGGLVPAG
jgi:hypothetical protein